ncbi:MAG: hypothetical protein M3281_10295 [Chloroflexota bacterium]|nr:hypothetical protein [Chloroflexota bacterium]
MSLPEDALLAMRDIMDGQLETSDERQIGRVADIEAEWREDGSLLLQSLIVGPEALAGRVSSRLRPLAASFLRGRFEHRIPVEEIEEVGPTVKLRKGARQYDVGHSDRWVVDHILRFIPGSRR